LGGDFVVKDRVSYDFAKKKRKEASGTDILQSQKPGFYAGCEKKEEGSMHVNWNRKKKGGGNVPNKDREVISPWSLMVKVRSMSRTTMSIASREGGVCGHINKNRTPQKAYRPGRKQYKARLETLQPVEERGQTQKGFSYGY